MGFHKCVFYLLEEFVFENVMNVIGLDHNSEMGELLTLASSQVTSVNLFVKIALFM